MGFINRTLQITDLALTAIGVVFAIVTLWMWADAVFWGGAYAYATAMAWTILTLITIGASAVVEQFENGEA